MLSIRTPQKIQGVSFIELMVALVAGLILMVGVMALSASILKNCMTAVKTTRLNYALQNALNIIVTDARRAGYWGNASTALGTNTNPNPFMTSTSDVKVNASNNCILFSYDVDNNGSLSTSNTANSNEHFGYRLQNGVIQGLTSDADYSCTSSAVAWQSLTDSSVVNVSNLTFSLVSTPVSITGLPASENMTIRTLTITITGQLASDSSVTKTVGETVHIRNDVFVP